MSGENKILAIANHLANRVRDCKQPYSRLKWIVENCDWQYKATKSELLEAYLAAINILKQSSVENAKRKPLTKLSKEQRTKMRKQAKELAAMLAGFLNASVEVTRAPIKTGANGEARIQIGIQRHASPGSTAFFYPTLTELNEWVSFDEANKIAFAYRFAQQLKPADELISHHIETIKAKLEASL